MPYISGTHRAWLETPLTDLVEWLGWNFHLMSTRDDTFYHVVRRLLSAFYSKRENEVYPPVDDEKRQMVDKKLFPLIETIKQNPALQEKLNGTLNYTICTIINALYSKENSKYSDYNNAIGVLETALRETSIDENRRYDAYGMIRCVAFEYYRRRIAPYEQDAADANGDIFE
jgi:hypothetical protein